MWGGGDCVTAGYFNNPTLSAERYMPDPFLGGERIMFRTRDLGRWTSDGQLEHMGRTDDQVKVRGHGTHRCSRLRGHLGLMSSTTTTSPNPTRSEHPGKMPVSPATPTTPCWWPPRPSTAPIR